MNKKHLIPIGVLAGTLVLTGVYGVTNANAATDTTNFPPLVQKMVEKFNLNSDEVKTLVEEDRTERQAERKVDFEGRLSTLVTEGKITEAQKAAIITKHEEIAAKREAIHDQNLDRDEMHTQMSALRDEMTAFLKDQGIDESVLPHMGGHKGGMRGGMMGEGRGGFGGGRMHGSLSQ